MKIIGYAVGYMAGSELKLDSLTGSSADEASGIRMVARKQWPAIYKESKIYAICELEQAASTEILPNPKESL